jgi:glycosyltransferase involved in cell wall biosynthesis
MKILLVNRVFFPDTHGTARFLTELADDLARAGHAVTVITGDRAGADPTIRFTPRENVHGVEVHRIPTAAFNRQRVLGWALNAASFYPGALWALLRRPRHDVALFLTDPPLVFVLGPLLRFLKGTRYVVWSMDLYPDVAIATGVLEADGWPARLAGGIARWAMRRADAVIALGEVMAVRLRDHRVPPDRIAVVHNWADSRVIRPIPHAQNAFIAEHGLAGLHVVAYTGNMGLSHEFQTILDGARALRDRADTVFLFIGGGKQAARVREAARDLPNVRFLPYIEEARLGEAVAAASVQVVTLQPGLEGLVVPSKFYTALAAGRPVIYIGPDNSEVSNLQVRGGYGMVVQPGNTAEFLKAVEMLRGDIGEVVGRAARKFFLSEFDRPIAAGKIAAILIQAAGRK